MGISSMDIFKSAEEKQFAMWLSELADRTGIEWEYEPQSFQLSEPVWRYEQKILKSGKKKDVRRLLMKEHGYKPDFRIIDDSRQFSQLFFYSFNTVWIDVKGTWSNRGNGQEFSINQKWLWQVHGIYVNKVIPEKLFFQTFAPEEVRLTPKTRKPTKFAQCQTVDRWLAENSGQVFQKAA